MRTPVCAKLPLLVALWGSFNLWAAGAPLRVLILSGQNNHEWRQTTPKLASVLTATGRFAVDITEHPEQCDAQSLSHYDALLSNWNNFGIPNATNWPESARAALLEFVRGGKGFVVVHAGGSSFYDWPGYQQLVGVSWKMGQTSHGSPHEFPVKFPEDHPITRGLAPFRTTDELWVRPGVGSLAHPIAFGDDQPLAFTLEFGKGRDFSLLLGHSAAFMETPGFQSLLIRGVEWAATGEVTLPPVTTADPARIEAVLKALAGYRFGENRKPVMDLERLAVEVSPDPAARTAVAAKLGAFLASDATVAAKQAACRQLSLIGSGVQAPLLAGLLENRDLGEFARQALERIPGSEAVAVLLSALETTTGDARVGVINSVAARRIQGAVPELTDLATNSDRATAGAALDALGRIGGAPAAAALLAVEAKVPASVRARWSLAVLGCAEGMIASGQAEPAFACLEKLTRSQESPSIRRTAFAACVKARGEKGTELLAGALAGHDEMLQEAAIRALREIPRTAPSMHAVATSLTNLPAPFQAQAIAWLGEARDLATQPVLLAAASSSTPAVRQAAIRALGSAGDASAIPVLLSIAAQGSAEEKRLAGEALVRLRGADVDEKMIAALRAVSLGEQRELIRALELRQAQAALPAMLELAGSKDSALSHAAIAAVGKLGDASVGVSLVAFAEANPQEAASAIAEICRRTASVEPLLTALPRAGLAGKAALVEALSSLGGTRSLEAARAELNAKEPEIQAAALRALANWPDAAPLEDLAAMAATTPGARFKALALRGVAHLAPLARDRRPEAVEIISKSLKVGGAPAEQKALLAALVEIPHERALKAAEACLDDPALAGEAKAAIAQIGERLAKAAALPWDDQIAALFTSPENLCRAATATNLDNLVPDGQGQGAFAAIDGDPATYWDETDLQPLYWLRVELKQPATVACLRILGYQHHNYAPKDFEVLGDGKLIKKVEGAVYRRNLLTVDLPPTVCRVIELKITGYYGQSPAIRELGLFSKPPATK